VDPTRSKHAGITVATLIVPGLDAAVSLALVRGAVQVGERFVAPHARGCRLRHPDGLVVEYLEHRPSAFDVATPGSFE
jgi:hypothetical protein